jgi:hypothetical protein
MAESPLDRLKRLALEKKAAQAQPVVSSGNKEEVSNDDSAGNAPRAVEESQLQTTGEDSVRGNTDGSSQELHQPTPNGQGGTEVSVSAQPASEPSPVNSAPVPVAQPVPTSNHPLAMQFAELEAALLAQDPEFKTKLREIHRHLGQEPELVTQMTEQEIQMVVSGLVVFANAEIVAPAAEKTAKAKIKAAAKVVISADDL